MEEQLPEAAVTSSRRWESAWSMTASCNSRVPCAGSRQYSSPISAGAHSGCIFLFACSLSIKPLDGQAYLWWISVYHNNVHYSSLNYRIAKAGRVLRPTFHFSSAIQSRVPRLTFKWLLEIHKEEIPKPLINLCQCSVNLHSAEVLLGFRGNLPCSSSENCKMWEPHQTVNIGPRYEGNKLQ